MAEQQRKPAQAREALNLRGELALTTKLGLPLALGEVGWMSTYIVDALMIGHLPNSPLAISASSLGNSIFYAVAICIAFLMNGLETLVAQAYGKNDGRECVYLLAQSFWFVALGTPFVIVVTLSVLHLLPFFGTPPKIYAETSLYLHPLLWSTAPLLTYMALRKFLQSVDSVFWVTISLITASPVNWLGDWVFLFGHLGVHPLGIAGSAWSTFFVRLFMLLLVVIGTLIALRRLDQPFPLSSLKPEFCRLRVLFRIGWPSGLESLAELGFTTFSSIVCAKLGAILLAGHQVLLDLNALVYQVPAGLSYATIVRTGQSAGRNNLKQVRLAAKASLVLGISFMVIAASVFAIFAPHWASLYTNSAQVVNVAVPVFRICGVLLITDTTFVILASVLTGLGDTRTPMIVSLACNWIVAMPMAYLLALHTPLALRGLWLGRAAGSLGTAVIMSCLWQRRIRRALLQPELALSQRIEPEVAIGGKANK